VREQVFFRRNNLPRQIVAAGFRSAAQAQTRGLESSIGESSDVDGIAQRAFELLAIGISRAGDTSSDHAAVFIAHDCGGSRSTSIDAQKQSHGIT
jgi:hypothetical protein